MGSAPNCDPYAATFKSKISAEAAASVRNALLITIEPDSIDVVDYYRRDEKGNPMPVQWRDITGRGPCMGPPKAPQ
jgi:hypothetical protein